MSRHTDANGDPIQFSDEEEQVLTDISLAIYRGKLILEAQPPITPPQATAIAEKFGQPLPEALLELWNVAYGGRLDYDLSVPLGDHAYEASFVELFYPESDGYRDLYGWIEAEEDAAFEHCEPGEEAPPLRYFPFGGFEYLERVLMRKSIVVPSRQNIVYCRDRTSTPLSGFESSWFHHFGTRIIFHLYRCHRYRDYHPVRGL